jgi:DNA (cytosine-5)-methyltransferase 1
MNELALFAGAGGGILGGTLLGWRTVCAVEIEDYPRRVLLQRQSDKVLPRFPIWDDVSTFDGKPWRGKVDIITGGFPCQDISVAGLGAGITGLRSGLWKEFARIIGEVQPHYVFIENSPNLRNKGLEVVLEDLWKLGYDAKWGVVGAHHAGAPHKRNRIWIVAHANGIGLAGRVHDRETPQPTERDSASGAGSDLAYAVSDSQRSTHGRASGISFAGWYEQSLSERDSFRGNLGDSSSKLNEEVRYSTSKGFQDGAGEQVGQLGSVAQSQRPDSEVADSDRERFEELNPSTEPSDARQYTGGDVAPGRGGWWATELGLGRVAHGVAHRVDRLKAIGNGQVPSVARLAWTLLGGE